MNAIKLLQNQQQSALEAMQSERDTAPAIYAELLDPDREPQAGDADRLREVMARLNLPLADVEKHTEARRRAGNLADLEQRIKEVAAQRGVASRELVEAAERFREIEKAWREERASLGMKSRSLEITADSLARDRERLFDLRRRYPIAFGDPAKGATSGN